MNELERLIMEIERKYSKLDEKSKRELVVLLTNLNEYLSIGPDAKKIRPIRVLIQKKINKETKKPPKIIGLDISFMQQLRNMIVHNQPIDNRLLLSFGNVLWKEIAETYRDDIPGLYNILSYAIQTKYVYVPSPGTINSPGGIVSYFNNIYEAKSDAEKAIIIKNLVPLVASKFKQRQGLISQKGSKNEDPLQKD